MEQNVLQSDSPVPSRLSQKAASVWQHYETAQACERDLATEQQITPIPKQGSDINTDGLNSQPPVLVEDCAPKQEPEGKNEEKVEDYTSSNSDGGGGDVEVAGDRTKLSTAAGELVGEKEDLLGNLQGTVLAEEGQGEREGPQEGDRLGFAKEISIAMAYVVPLPHSPSTNSSSPSSSIFVTPASTPSRSPSPLPPSSSSSHPHFLTSSPQVITSLSGLVDGYHDNELPELTPNDAHQNESHSGEPQLPTYPPHPVTTDAYAQTEVPSIASSFSQTDAPVLKEFIEMCTNTECSELIDSGVQTDEEGERGRTEVACNTELRIPPEVLERAKLAEQLAQIQSEHAAGIVERNEARSQQMVAEELARIVQSELAELRQRNVAETTTRIRLENQLGELKVELSSAHRELEDKGQRVMELEETVKGTSLLVRKLEEQNAATLMNRGGIDYMLQAKLADARAQEAEQKLEVAQVEMLQSQGEVKRLLDRVGVATRDRSEMVSSKVHNQLLQISDERAHAAEQRAVQLEKELLSLREQSGDSGGDVSHRLSGNLTQSSLSLSTYSRPSSYTTTLGGYPSLSSTLPPPSLSSSLLPPSSSLLPSSSSPSLEPFKLSFSLPSAAGVSDSDQATLPSSTGSSTFPLSDIDNKATDESTGLLKPSSILGRETGTQKHVMSDTSAATTMSSVLSEQHEVTAATHDHASFELPSFTSEQDLPPPVDSPIVTDRDKDSSSDWSSSNEEDEDSTVNPLRPSSHSSLKAQWEWRAMGETDSEKHMAPLATGHTPKKKPPPVAPKPRLLWINSTPATEPHWQEDPSSFLEPTRVSGLNPLSSSFRRPLGPYGRNLPTRFSNYEQLFDQKESQ